MTPAEKEAYEVGYMVGGAQVRLAEKTFDSDLERQAYRRGYVAGCVKRTQQPKQRKTNGRK